ncbi:transposase [Succinimonas sp.]|uniref:transposase n=1 Tax=Succinimonas sp. TaxID=1936151 RepID=UPI00386D8A8C
MVLDNAPWHKKAIRLIWEEELPEYQDIRDKMTYISMPPYSPDLNPIEQVWRITRREMTHNRYFPSRIDLEKNWMLTILSTENLMRNWQVSVVSSAFGMNRFWYLYNSEIKFVYYILSLRGDSG